MSTSVLELLQKMLGQSLLNCGGSSFTERGMQLIHNVAGDNRDIEKQMRSHLTFGKSSYVDDDQTLLFLYYWTFWAALSYYEPAEIAEVLGPIIQMQQIASGNDLFMPVHYIFIDPVSKSIIVSIRGTYSANDGITDAVATMSGVARESVDSQLGLIKEIPGYPWQAYAHNGFLKSGNNVLGSVLNWLRDTQLQYPDYGIKIVGHSLGAGTAAVVTWLLNQNHGIKARGIGVATPPTFDIETCKIMCNDGLFVSIANGADIVTRASYQNIHNFLCDDGVNYGPSYVPGKLFWIDYFQTPHDRMISAESSVALDPVRVYRIFADNPIMTTVYTHSNLTFDHSATRYWVLLNEAIKNLKEQ